MMHKPVTGSWVKPTNYFTPAPELGRPSGGSSPVIHFFRDQETGARWIGKCGQVPLRDKEVIEAARRLPGFLGVYADEILEKLGLAVYQLLGTEVPESALSYQQVRLEAMHPDMLLAMQLNAEDEGRVFELPHSPRMHYLSRYVDEFQPLDKGFVEHYLANAKRCGNEYVKIPTRDGEMLPLRGLGGMLAAADFVYDMDCLGDACGNAGYLIREDRASGERYAQLVKIDAGYAFSYSDLRTDQRHNPRDREIRVAPNQLRLQFADLAPADQREFAAAAKRILATPYEEFAHLFAQTQSLEEGIAAYHCQQLLDELIARKSLFLKAFAPETDRAIVKEIEAAQAKVAKKFDDTEEVSPEAIEELLAQERKEAIALAKLRVRLAVVDVEQSDPKEVGECKTFQLPVESTHFVGREDALVDLVKCLNQSRSGIIGQSISGIGGVGKTQLALRYAQAAANGECIAGQHLAYDYVVWLNAEVYLEGQFQALAEVWTGKQFNTEDAIPAVYSHLAGKRSLFVFDNAENARSIAGFLPSAYYASSMHLLITSRSDQWGEVPVVKLRGFNVEETTEYVEYHLGLQPKDAIAKLVALLEGLPLAISQAVSFIKAGHSSLENFEQQFYLNQANLLSHDLIEEESHPKTVGTTLTLALAQAKVQSPIAERLLGIVAYLFPQSIQIGLLARALESSDEEILKGIEVLRNYSLVVWQAGSESVQVHRLVQEVIRYRHRILADKYDYLLDVLVLLKEVLVFDESDLKAMSSCNHIVAHVVHLAEISKRFSLTENQKTVFGLLLKSTGHHQIVMGNYEVSKNCLEHSLELLERQLGSDQIIVVDVLAGLGVAYGNLGNPRKKKELLERSIINYEKLYGVDNPSTGQALMNLGNVLVQLGDIQKAKELLERSLNIQEKHCDPDDPDVGKVLVGLGGVYAKIGQLTGDTEEILRKSEILLKRALYIFVKHYGQNHPDVASAMVNLSIVLYLLDKHEEAMVLSQNALTINEQHYGFDHPRVAAVLVSLGQQYGGLGDKVKEKEVLARALTIFEKCYGPDHAHVADTLKNLGDVYSSLGDVGKQKESLERALSIRETNYGSDHPELISVLRSLAKMYSTLGRKSEQKDYLEQVLRIQEINYGLDSHQVMGTLVTLSGVHGRLGNVIEGNKLLERAFNISEKCYGSDGAETAVALLDLGVAHGKLGNLEQQKELLERALNLQMQHSGSDPVKTGVSLVKFAKAYGKLGDTSKQQTLLMQAVMVFQKHYGSIPNPKLAVALILLSNTYTEPKDVPRKKELLEVALNVQLKYYKQENPEIAQTLGNLGDTYRMLKDLNKAMFFLNRALDIFEKCYGPDHSEVATVLYNLSLAYRAKGNMSKRRVLLERALVIFERHHGPEHLIVGDVLFQLGVTYGNLKEPEKQKEVLERALVIKENHYGPDHLEVVFTMGNLGNAYGALGDLQRQINILERSLPIVENHYGSDDREVASVLFSLGNAYGILGDPLKQKELLERSVEIDEKHLGPDHIDIMQTLFFLSFAYFELKDYAMAIRHAKRVYTAFAQYFGEEHLDTLKIRNLIEKCEQQLQETHASNDIIKGWKRAELPTNVERVRISQTRSNVRSDSREKEEPKISKNPVNAPRDGSCIVS